MRIFLVVIVVILVFVLGIGFGVHIDAKYRHSITALVVQRDNKEVNILPQAGDELIWLRMTDKDGPVPIQAYFGPTPADSPCDQDPQYQGRCVIRASVNPYAVYMYGCVDPSDPSFYCLDPGVGPRSGTGGGGQNPYIPPPDFFRVFKSDLDGFFHISKPNLVAEKLKAMTSDQSSLVLPKAPGLAAAHRVLPPGSNMNTQVSCVANETIVTTPFRPYEPNPSVADGPLHVFATDTVFWKSNVGNGSVAIDGLSGICADASNGCKIPAGSAPASYTYHVTANACGASKDLTLIIDPTS